MSLVDDFRKICQEENLPWIEPLITEDRDDELAGLVYEWWHGERKLTLYCSKALTWALQVSGTSIESDMVETYLGHPDELKTLWLWLLGRK